MFANHIGDLRVGKLTTMAPSMSADFEFFPGLEKTHSLGFMRMVEDVPGMRAAGSQGWAGVASTHFLRYLSNTEFVRFGRYFAPGQR